jgi:hypothetical protein
MSLVHDALINLEEGPDTYFDLTIASNQENGVVSYFSGTLQRLPAQTGRFGLTRHAMGGDGDMYFSDRRAEGNQPFAVAQPERVNVSLSVQPLSPGVSLTIRGGAGVRIAARLRDDGEALIGAGNAIASGGRAHWLVTFQGSYHLR